MADTTQPHPEPQEAISLPRYTIDCSSNEYGTHWNVEVDSEGSLCLYADAQSQLTALRMQLQEQALQYLSDNGQWIEETGRLRTERDEALARIKAIEGDSANVARGSAFICPKCGIDRFKASCPDVGNCGIKITASMAPKETP